MLSSSSTTTTTETTSGGSIWFALQLHFFFSKALINSMEHLWLPTRSGLASQCVANRREIPDEEHDARWWVGWFGFRVVFVLLLLGNFATSSHQSTTTATGWYSVVAAMDGWMVNDRSKQKSVIGNASQALYDWLLWGWVFAIYDVKESVSLTSFMFISG